MFQDAISGIYETFGVNNVQILIMRHDISQGAGEDEEGESYISLNLMEPTQAVHTAPSVEKAGADSPKLGAVKQEIKEQEPLSKKNTGATSGAKVYARRAGIEHFLSYGIMLLPCRAFVDDKGETKYKPIAGKEYYERIGITTIEKALAYNRGGELWTATEGGETLKEAITMFRYVPRDNGLLVIDIDRGHGDGIDGVEVFYNYLAAAGAVRPGLPSTLKDITGGSFPCYLTTPSGGFQLIFKYQGTAKLKGALARGVDILRNTYATAAGSRKANGLYILHGDLSDAPTLYHFLEHLVILLTEQTTTAAATSNRPTAARWARGRQGYQDKKPFDGETTWEKVIEFSEIDGLKNGEWAKGKAARAFCIALHAKTHNWTYDETLSHLQAEPNIEGLPRQEIFDAVKSAYKGR